MSGRRWAALLAVALLAAALLGSCGGGDDNATRSSAANASAGEAASPTSPRVLALANANCRRLLRGVIGVAKRSRTKVYSTTLETVTEGLGAPAMRLVKRTAARQRALEPLGEDPLFDAYVGFFDPIIVLGEQRLQAGRSVDVPRAERLQNLLTTLDEEQRAAARRAGLDECDRDFFATMVRVANR